MAALANFPQVVIKKRALRPFGKAWLKNGEKLSRTPPRSSIELGHLFDLKVGKGLAAMLGGIPIVTPNANQLLPPQSDCVEIGPCRIVGGIRPQNFDVGYRPDGVRFAFDSKTLNDKKSIQKNYQNMINDLATEAATVHTRFPTAVVAFLIAVPAPCLMAPQRTALISTLERLTGRLDSMSHTHRAEAASLVIWEPDDGSILKNWPPPNSPLRIEKFGEQIQNAYFSRFQGMPPHATVMAIEQPVNDIVIDDVNKGAEKEAADEEEA